MMHATHGLKAYYSRRASEYERIYHRDDAERQEEQAALATAMRHTLRRHRVLEVACGTGFWTQVAAQAAEHVVATDVSAEMLAIAKHKGLPPSQVDFRQADAYDLATVSGTFDAGLANFWFSHVPKGRVDEFLNGLHRRLGDGSVVFMADNVYVPGVGGELIAHPGCEDTFKARTLFDGSRYEVLKNYYDENQLHRIFAPWAQDPCVHVGTCFWWIAYAIKECA